MPEVSIENAVALPAIEAVPSMLSAALAQIHFARGYVQELLAATDRSLWHTCASGSPTTVAWQVGHLAVSQYGLLMFRLYGRRDADLELVPSKFRKTFGKGSDPLSDTVQQYSASELLERMDLIYQHSLAGLVDISPALLMEPVEMPYAVTRSSWVRFCFVRCMSCCMLVKSV